MSMKKPCQFRLACWTSSMAPIGKRRDSFGIPQAHDFGILPYFCNACSVAVFFKVITKSCVYLKSKELFLETFSFV